MKHTKSKKNYKEAHDIILLKLYNLENTMWTILCGKDEVARMEMQKQHGDHGGSS